MMLHKALLFADYESARKIHQTRNVREQKALGRGIKGFDDSTWTKFRTEIVYHGNKLKFAQNSEIDLGYGLGKEDPRAWTRETWIGSNL